MFAQSPRGIYKVNKKRTRFSEQRSSQQGKKEKGDNVIGEYPKDIIIQST